MAVDAAVLNTYTVLVSALLFSGVLIGHRFGGTLKTIIAGFVLFLAFVFVADEALLLAAKELSPGVLVMDFVRGVIGG